MNEEIIKKIAEDLKVKIEQVKAVLELLENDHTVAFIARYRKEATGGLDEEQIRVIDDEYQYGLSLQKRKDDVIRLIEEKGLLTEELKATILQASKLIEVEDLYRPYKEKKKTKATAAIALGSFSGFERLIVTSSLPYSVSAVHFISLTIRYLRI